MSFLKDVFCSSSMRKAVEETHEAVKEQHDELTLAQCFIIGNRWSPEKVKREYEKLDELYDFYVNTWEYDKATPSLKDFGLHNSREIQNAWIRAKFLKRMQHIPKMKDLIEAPDTSACFDLDRIEELSLHAREYSCLLMPIKGFLCAQEGEAHFKGIVPYTSPVKRALKILQLNENISNYTQTELCTRIGYEVGKDRMYVNTALWVIGNT